MQNFASCIILNDFYVVGSLAELVTRLDKVRGDIGQRTSTGGS